MVGNDLVVKALIVAARQHADRAAWIVATLV